MLSITLLKRVQSVIFWCFLISFTTQTYASHIFGGYINMVQIDQVSGKFLLSMNTYLDMAELKTQEEIDVAFYSSEEVKIYRKKDHLLMRMWVWPRPVVDTLIYKNRACAEQKRLKTWVFKYQLEITLPPKEFSDPDGYYISRERCCRNAALTNIQRPSDTGMVFYSEFPSLFQNGQPIKYSSPIFGPLNGEYLCANKTSKYDFSATDPNGDELRYTLTDPVRGNTGPIQISITFPGPYLPVEWLPGFSATNAIPGTIPLRIDSKTGMLTVRANRIGLFVFSVQVEKIRNGQRIGMIRHEFQLPVVDCSAKTPPVPIITYQGKPVTEVAICPNEIITLETEFNDEWAFQWQKNGDNLDNAISNKLQVTDIGEYSVVKSLLKTCSNDTTGPAVKLKIADKVTQVKINSSGQNLCYGDSLLLKASSTSADSVTFEWLKNSTLLHTGNTFQIKEPGIYSLRAGKSNLACAGKADSIQIQELPPLNLPLTKDTTLCEGDTITLQTAFMEGWQYNWFKDQKLLTGNTSFIKINQIGAYQVKATDLNGCRGITSYQIAYDPDCNLKSTKIYIPDVFTPNGDGNNDTFQIYNLDSDCVVNIYNRWGEIIFHSVGYQTPWEGRLNGQLLPCDAYVYDIKLPQKDFSYRGKVLIIY